MNAIATKLVAQVMKAEVAKAIEIYKDSADFKDEVSEAACNTFEKGFEECDRKVFETSTC